MSESSASSVTASEHDDSSSQSPEAETGEHEVEDTGYDEYMEDDGKPPEYRAEGLVTLWKAPGNDEDFGEITVPVINYDIIVVHGLHGARRPPWKNPGSGDSSWVHELGRHGGRTVMSFGYDPLHILSGSRTWESIRRTAVRLLEDLKKARADAPSPRPIMFVAHDIGGIIVKDALTYAGLYPSSYGEIFDLTRLLVFYGCPHQSVDRLDMEDRLSRFMLSHFDRNAPQLQGTLASAKGLTTAVLDINHLFIDSKHVYRSHVISVYNDSDDSQIDKVFDSFAGTLRVPFERRVPGGITHTEDMEVIEPHLVKIHAQLYPDAAILEQERILLSIARPTAALTTADHEKHPFAWIGENETYKSWLRQKQPQLLYLHGSSGVRQAAEFAFYDLDNSLRGKDADKNEMVLYFTFDRHDERHDTTEDMLTTFLAQIICHNPSLSEYVVNHFERLALDRSWSDYDLLTWFEYYRVRGQVDGVSCVINCFEECEDESRKQFLYLVKKLSGTHERPWRIIVTSREHGALSEELKDWPSIDLDTTPPPAKEGDDKETTNMWMSSSKLLRLRPELRDNRALDEELKIISELDPSIRGLVLAHVSQHSKWPQEEVVETIFGPVKNASVKDIFDEVVDAIPDSDRDFALRALSWIVCAPRPLTVWELAMALFIGSEGDDGEQAVPDYGYVEDVIPRLVEWFAGIVVLEIHEIRLASPHFRQVIFDKVETIPKWTGKKFLDAVNKDIVETSINFLLRQPVKHVLENVYGKGKEKASVMQLPTSSDRCNFATYAVLYWLSHLQMISNDASLTDLLQKFIESDSVPIWSKAYWALANPITRSPEFFPSIYPILTGRGLYELAEPLRQNDEDISAGLVEACLNSRPDIVSYLLGRIEHSEKALQQALVAAGSNADEEVWNLVIHHVRENHTGFPWPESLLARAAWLGHVDIVKELLEVGCDPNPVNTIQGATPLHLAARNGHRYTVKVLLDHKADAKHIGQYGRTALHVATVFGHDKIVEQLIKESDVDINALDEDSVTAVYVGSLWGNWKAVETLVKNGANPDLGDLQPGVPQWNPLVCAVEEGHTLCVRALLDNGADPNFVGLQGTPLRYAVSAGRIDITRLLIEKGADLNHEKIDPPILTVALNSWRFDTGEARLEMVRLLIDKGAKLDVVDEDGETPLVRAVCTRDEDKIPLVAYLLGKDVDVNGLSGPRKETALHYAVRMQDTDLVKLLVEKGAEVNPTLHADNDMGSPLHMAVWNTDMTKLLLENKADVTVTNDKVASVLIMATLANHIESVQMLLDHNAPLEDEDPKFDGFTALSYAANYGYSDIFRLLADSGADINHAVSKKRTVLHLAVNEESLGAVLEYRPPVDIQDEDGNTPLHYTRSWTPLENVKLLIRAGANLDIKNKEDLTPLSHAIREAQEEVAEYLLSKSSTEIINIVSPIHGTALHLACSYTQPKLVKFLIEKGADVNVAVTSVAATPLQSAILCINNYAARESSDSGSGSDDIAAIVDLLIDAGADITAEGGQFQTTVAAAALQGSASLLRTLMEKGGKTDVPDVAGRLPIHLASVHSADHFGIILETDANPLVKDKAGRTALHWAAQGGLTSVVEQILKIAGDKVVDQPDNDGWTPLCWAARGCGTHFSTIETSKQVEVIKTLIEHGAKIDYKPKGDGKRPIDIARYHTAAEEVLEVLAVDEKDKPKKAAEKDAEKDGEENEEEGDDSEKEPAPPVLYHHYNAYCAYCLFDIAGFLYKCETCPDLSYCYKCHKSCSDFHPSHHTFKEIGPEFQSASAPSSESGDGTGSNTPDSDDEEDDDGSEEEDSDDDDSDDDSE
ncbi:ankyrin repeat-containing domain protein [Coniochaeta sp. 2T2.1]|nr:ankyrin repeat-containing domain protein [Coniochaeta sp. 2T2.1]